MGLSFLRPQLPTAGQFKEFIWNLPVFRSVTMLCLVRQTWRQPLGLFERNIISQVIILPQVGFFLAYLYAAGTQHRNQQPAG